MKGRQFWLQNLAQDFFARPNGIFQYCSEWELRIPVAQHERKKKAASGCGRGHGRGHGRVLSFFPAHVVRPVSVTPAQGIRER